MQLQSSTILPGGVKSNNRPVSATTVRACNSTVAISVIPLVSASQVRVVYGLQFIHDLWTPSTIVSRQTASCISAGLRQMTTS